MGRNTKQPEMMPCYGCNGSGSTTIIIKGRRVNVKCKDCNGKGGWSRY